MTNMIFTSAVWTINIKALDHKLDTALYFSHGNGRK